MRFCAFLICLFVSYSAQASVSWHSITPEIQFLQQQNKLCFYDSNQVLIEGKECALMFDASGNFAEVEKLAVQLKTLKNTIMLFSSEPLS